MGVLWDIGPILSASDKFYRLKQPTRWRDSRESEGGKSDTILRQINRAFLELVSTKKSRFTQQISEKIWCMLEFRALGWQIWRNVSDRHHHESQADKLYQNFQIIVEMIYVSTKSSTW